MLEQTLRKMSLGAEMSVACTVGSTACLIDKGMHYSDNAQQL